LANILVVDDDRNIRRMLATALEAAGYKVVEADSAAQALARLTGSPVVDLVLTDVRMEKMDGIALLEQIKQTRPAMPVVIMTAFGSIPAAVEAMRLGAYDYVPKPFSAQQIRQTVARALEIQSLKQENRVLKSRLERLSGMDRFLASSSQTSALLEVAGQAAASDATVLLTGESGTGKSLLARYIHQQSPRKAGPFVSVACTTLSEHLLESELFGHVRGSFTGAIKDKPGRLEAAEGGTVLLDEIGDLTPVVQSKLLRFLQERTFERVGGNETLRVDVRIIAATNRDLGAEIKKGAFREDLFYRLNVVAVEIPALRERRADVPALASFFLRRYAAENGKTIETFADDALAALLEYHWPGNVRELENVVERAVVLCDAHRIEKKHLSPTVVPTGDGETLPPIPGSTIADLERYAILKTLEACGGSTSKAATVLGVSPRKIQYKLHEYTQSSTAPDEKKA
jgi:DNA-binding NtrC family response regulator